MKGFIKVLVAVFGLMQLALGALTDKELTTLVKNNGKNKVIKITDSNYEDFLNGAKDYHLVLFLYSTASQINCVLCSEFKPDFELIANSWFQDHPDGVAQEDGEETSKNVYFLQAEFLDARKLFGVLELNNIPKVYHFPPTTNNKANAFLKEYNEYQFFQGVHRDLLSSYLQSVTGHKFNIYVPPDYSRVIINAIGTFAFVILLRRYSTQAISIVSSRMLWSSITVLGILVLISGYMFNQIRGVPYVREHQSHTEYIAPGQQMQYGIETQIVSFIYGTLSVLVVFLIQKAPKVKNPQANFIAVVVLSGAIFVVYSILLSVFGLKGIGYPFQFVKFI